jgi:hypothetical protein
MAGCRWSSRKVEVAGDRHRYRYVGPFGARPRRLYDGMEDLTGWDVLVVQQELHSDDRRKLWVCPVRVYAAPPGVPRPDPDRPPEEQGWQELRHGMLRRPRAPGTGAFFQQRLARLMAGGIRGWSGTGGASPTWRVRPRMPRWSGSKPNSRGGFGWPGGPGAAAASAR